MTEAVSVAAAYLGALTRASGVSVVGSAEAVAVSAAVLVDRSIGHLMLCRARKGELGRNDSFSVTSA